MKGGVIGASAREKPGFWPETRTNESDGGNADLWGEEWSQTDINSPEFGVAIAALPGGYGGRASVEVVSVEVDYSYCE